MDDTANEVLQGFLAEDPLDNIDLDLGFLGDLSNGTEDWTFTAAEDPTNSPGFCDGVGRPNSVYEAQPETDANKFAESPEISSSPAATMLGRDLQPESMPQTEVPDDEFSDLFDDQAIYESPGDSLTEKNDGAGTPYPTIATGNPNLIHSGGRQESPSIAQLVEGSITHTALNQINPSTQDNLPSLTFPGRRGQYVDCGTSEFGPPAHSLGLQYHQNNHTAGFDMRSERPWNGQHQRPSKFAEKPRRLPKENSDYEPNSKYDLLAEPPRPWGGCFQYNQYGELDPQLLFTVEEINKYLWGHPHHGHLRNLRQSKLIIRIQRNPPRSASRWPYCHGSYRCRFKHCPADFGTISQGSMAVAFDELSADNPNLDPYHNAMYVHLFCLEYFCDFPKICAHLNVQVENRNFHKETNLFIPKPAEVVKAARDFVQMCQQGLIPRDYPRFDSRDDVGEPYEGTLCYHLYTRKRKHQARGTIRQEKRREKLAGREDEGGATLTRHLGNIFLESPARKRTRTHKNQNQLLANPRQERVYKHNTNSGMDQHDNDEEEDVSSDEADDQVDGYQMQPQQSVAPTADMESRVLPGQQQKGAHELPRLLPRHSIREPQHPTWNTPQLLEDIKFSMPSNAFDLGRRMGPLDNYARYGPLEAPLGVPAHQRSNQRGYSQQRYSNQRNATVAPPDFEKKRKYDEMGDLDRPEFIDRASVDTIARFPKRLKSGQSPPTSMTVQGPPQAPGGSHVAQATQGQKRKMNEAFDDTTDTLSNAACPSINDTSISSGSVPLMKKPRLHPDTGPLSQDHQNVPKPSSSRQKAMQRSSNVETAAPMTVPQLPWSDDDVQIIPPAQVPNAWQDTVPAQIGNGAATKSPGQLNHTSETPPQSDSIAQGYRPPGQAVHTPYTRPVEDLAPTSDEARINSLAQFNYVPEISWPSDPAAQGYLPFGQATQNPSVWQTAVPAPTGNGTPRSSLAQLSHASEPPQQPDPVEQGYGPFEQATSQQQTNPYPNSYPSQTSSTYHQSLPQQPTWYRPAPPLGTVLPYPSPDYQPQPIQTPLYQARPVHPSPYQTQPARRPPSKPTAKVDANRVKKPGRPAKKTKQTWNDGRPKRQRPRKKNSRKNKDNDYEELLRGYEGVWKDGRVDEEELIKHLDEDQLKEYHEDKARREGKGESETNLPNDTHAGIGGQREVETDLPSNIQAAKNAKYEAFLEELSDLEQNDK